MHCMTAVSLEMSDEPVLVSEYVKIVYRVELMKGGFLVFNGIV